MSFSGDFLVEVRDIANLLDRHAIEDGGTRHGRHPRPPGPLVYPQSRGGSATNASHAVNDFREIASLEAADSPRRVRRGGYRTDRTGSAQPFL